MKTFIQQTTFFFLIFVLIFVCLALINFYLINTESLICENKKVLILGDSSTECAINDTIYNSSINKSVAGDSYFYSFLRLKKFTNNSTSIDTVFLSFAPHNIYNKGWLLDSYNVYTNFAKYYPLMSESEFLFILQNNFKAVLSALPNVIKLSIKNIIKKLIYRNLMSDYGRFYSLNRDLLNDMQAKLKNNEKLPFFNWSKTIEVSAIEQLYLDKIIKYCSKKGIELVLISTPKRHELLEYSRYGLKEFYEFYDKQYLAVDFMDFSNLSLPEDNYGDFVHLNSKGSTTFTNILIKKGFNALFAKYGRTSNKKDSLNRGI